MLLLFTNPVALFRPDSHRHRPLPGPAAPLHGGQRRVLLQRVAARHRAARPLPSSLGHRSPETEVKC